MRVLRVPNALSYVTYGGSWINKQNHLPLAAKLREYSRQGNPSTLTSSVLHFTGFRLVMVRK